MSMAKGLGIGLGFALWSSVRLSLAEPERFGERGQLVLDQSHPLTAARLSPSAPAVPGLTQYHLGLAPAISWFVVPKVSVRLGLRLAHGWSTSDADFDLGSTTSFGATTGVGYAVPLNEHFSLWPQANVGFARYWVEQDPPFIPPADVDTLAFSGWLPLLWHPAEHLIVGLGPGVSADFAGPRLAALEHNGTMLYAGSMLGGYFSP
jgi:hypothetical protein